MYYYQGFPGLVDGRYYAVRSTWSWYSPEDDNDDSIDYFVDGNCTRHRKLAAAQREFKRQVKRLCQQPWYHVCLLVYDNTSHDSVDCLDWAKGKTRRWMLGQKRINDEVERTLARARANMGVE